MMGSRTSCEKKPDACSSVPEIAAGPASLTGPVRQSCCCSPSSSALLPQAFLAPPYLAQSFGTGPALSCARGLMRTPAAQKGAGTCVSELRD